MAPDLEIVSGHSQWRVTLTHNRVTFGKGHENDVAINDSTVSHIHATFVRFSAGWCINDLGSSNGTWLNGERIWSKQRLRDGDEIRLGHTRLAFQDPDARHPPTEAEDAPPKI